MSGKSWEQKLMLFGNLSDGAKGMYCECPQRHEHLDIAEYTFFDKS